MESKEINGQSAAKGLSSEKEYNQSSSTILRCGEVLININPVNWEMVDTKKDKTYIYCLIDPVTNEIRYVGITIDLRQRYRSHCCNSKTENTWKHSWAKKLKDEGLKPLIYILEILEKNSYPSVEEWNIKSDERETYYIQLLGRNGFKLLNHAKLLSFDYSYTTQGQHKNTKKLYQYDGDTLLLVKEWDSLKQATIELNCSYSGLSCACSRKTKQFGHYWSLNKLDKFIKKEPRGNKCYRYTLYGEYIDEYKSIASAGRILNINRCCIQDNIRGIQLSAGEFIFKDYKVDKIDSYDVVSIHNRYKNSHFTVKI